MITTTTTQELGQTPGRARCLAAARTASVVRTARTATGSWRHQAFAHDFHGTVTTGVAHAGTAYVGNPTTGGKGLMSIKRPARHLGTRST